MIVVIETEVTEMVVRAVVVSVSVIRTLVGVVRVSVVGSGIVVGSMTVVVSVSSTVVGSITVVFSTCIIVVGDGEIAVISFVTVTVAYSVTVPLNPARVIVVVLVSISWGGQVVCVGQLLNPHVGLSIAK